MPTPPLSDDVLAAAVALRQAHPSEAGAARAGGLDRKTLQHRLKRAAERGLMGFSPVLPGFRVSQTTAQYDAAGEIRAQSVQQRPELGEAFVVPAGHVVKGISALLHPDGREMLKWVKTREEQGSDSVLAAFVSVMAAYEGHAVLPTAPAHVDEDLATFYNLADHHLGLFAWAKETGEDFDLKIGEDILRRAMANLVASAPSSGTAVILNLGDFFHADNGENRTAKSGNVLDVDTRYAKVLQIGVKLQIDCIELALQKHARVLVRCLPGNHDPHTALALSVALAAFFRNDERVTVDCDPSKFFWWRFGKVFVGATHGDMVKPAQMPGVMASYRAKDWGETEHRYAYFGHVHHSSVGGGEGCGVVWETFQSLTAKDAWHHSSGYKSGRSMVAITHHREDGEVQRHTVTARRAMAPL